MFDYIYSAKDQWANAGAIDTLEDVMAKSIIEQEKNTVPKEAISEMQRAQIRAKRF